MKTDRTGLSELDLVFMFGSTDRLGGSSKGCGTGTCD